MAGATLPYRSVLITGASGFVGRYLLNALRARLGSGAVVHCASRSDGMPVDLLDENSLRVVVAEARPDLVFHLAAQSSVGQSSGAAATTWRVNAFGTLNLAEAITAEAPEAVVAFASSSEVYGATFNEGPVDESAVLAPLSVYARTKRGAEDVLRDTLSPTNRLVVFRPTNHSGPGQDARFVLPAFADQIAAIEAGRKPPVMQVGSLTAERDFLDVRDVVEAYLDVLASPELGRCETFNVASGNPIPISHVLDQLLAMTASSVKIEQDLARQRPSEIPRAAVNAEKIWLCTGWKPRHSLHEMIADVLTERRHFYIAGKKSGA